MKRAEIIRPTQYRGAETIAIFFQDLPRAERLLEVASKHADKALEDLSFITVLRSDDFIVRAGNVNDIELLLRHALFVLKNNPFIAKRIPDIFESDREKAAFITAVAKLKFIEESEETEMKKAA